MSRGSAPPDLETAYTKLLELHTKTVSRERPAAAVRRLDTLLYENKGNSTKRDRPGRSAVNTGRAVGRGGPGGRRGDTTVLTVAGPLAPHTALIYMWRDRGGRQFLLNLVRVWTRSTDRERSADRPAGVPQAPPAPAQLPGRTWTVDAISEDKETMEVLPVAPQFAGFDSEKGCGGRSWCEPGEAALARRLESELRAALGEVPVPASLARRAARQALQLASSEPCGARGAAVVLWLGSRRVAAFKLQAGALPTHELHLELQPQSGPGWTDRLPLFLRPTALSPHFSLSKKRLFRSDHSEPE